MENKTFLQKLIIYIKNFIKVIIIAILAFFRALFKPQKNNKTKYINQVENSKNTSKKDLNDNYTTLPEDPNTKNNPDINVSSDETNSEQEKNLELPKRKTENINSNNINTSIIIYNFETIKLLIEEELEKKYKDDNFKIKDTTKEIKEKIEELEEKIIPPILDKINNKKLTDEKEIKKEIEEVIEEELKEKPLFPQVEILEVKNDENKKQSSSLPNDNIYSIALPLEKELKLQENKVNKINNSSKIATLPQENEIKKKIDETPVMMVPNVNEIPKPTKKDQIKNAAVTTTIIAANLAKSILPNHENKEDEKESIHNESSVENNLEENKQLSEIKNDLEKDSKSIEELTILQEELKEKIEQIKDNHEQSEEKKEIVKDLIKDTEISAISITSEALINDSKTELTKEEFEDRDYDRVENQIDKMLNDITNTFLKYENSMTEKQKKKLKKEEENLRNAKDYIQSQKSQDLITEQKILNEKITDEEISGLQIELKKIDDENKTKVNEDLFRRMDKLEGMTANEIANADKKILLKHFNKASILLEMSSLLALPFVRNKYFFYFTVGLIIDNHFNFINSFFKRKINKHEPPDLTTIRKGQDALNGALDITYKNIIELDYLEEQALARYPELAYDQDFINQVTRLRTNLNAKYNKLMKKNKKMEKYYMKSKHQIKILKKTNHIND